MKGTGTLAEGQEMSVITQELQGSKASHHVNAQLRSLQTLSRETRGMTGCMRSTAAPPENKPPAVTPFPRN
ncbi:hypothetical protein INR49_013290 [Caranx melampygus]|nr:hypothetical protein INR49_013290 [Caranx melampygus]